MKYLRLILLLGLVLLVTRQLAPVRAAGQEELPPCATPEQLRALVAANPGGEITLTGDIIWDDYSSPVGDTDDWQLTTINMNGHRLILPEGSLFCGIHLLLRGQANEQNRGLPLVEMAEHSSLTGNNLRVEASGEDCLALAATNPLLLDVDYVEASGNGARGILLYNVGPGLEDESSYLRFRQVEVAGDGAVGVQITGAWEAENSAWNTFVVAAQGREAVALQTSQPLYLESWTLQARGPESYAIRAEDHLYLRFCEIASDDGLGQAAGELVLDGCDVTGPLGNAQIVARKLEWLYPMADIYTPLGLDDPGLPYNDDFLVQVDWQRTTYQGSYFRARAEEEWEVWEYIDWNRQALDLHTVGAYRITGPVRNDSFTEAVAMPTLEVTVHVGYYPYQIMKVHYQGNTSDLVLTLNTGDGGIDIAFESLVLWYRTDTETEWRSRAFGLTEGDFYPLYVNGILWAGFGDYAFDYAYWQDDYWQDGQMVPPHQYLEIQLELVGGDYAGRNASYFFTDHPDPNADHSTLPHVPDGGGDQGGGDDGRLPSGPNPGDSGNERENATGDSGNSATATADDTPIAAPGQTPTTSPTGQPEAPPALAEPDQPSIEAQPPATEQSPMPPTTAPATPLAVSAGEISDQLTYNQAPLTLIENRVKVVLPLEFLEALALGADSQLTLSASADAAGFAVQFTLDGQPLTVPPGQTFQLYLPHAALTDESGAYACEDAAGNLIYATGYDNGWLIFTLSATGRYRLLPPVGAVAVNEQPAEENLETVLAATALSSPPPPWWPLAGGGLLLGGGTVALWRRVRYGRRVS